MPDILTNGVKIHYERSGGQRPPLLLLHGITDTGACWPRVVGALRDDYDLIMLDARGHGLSEGPASGYTWDVLADDVAAVIKALGLTKPGLMGHSMGALTAALVAAHYPNLPGYLVLEDPPMRDLSTAEAQQAWRERSKNMRPELIVRQGMSTEQMVEFWTKTHPELRTWDAVEFGPWSEAKRRAKVQVIDLVDVPPPSYKGIFARIACPTLLIAADPARLPAVDPQVGRDVAATNRNVQVVTMYGAGHNIRREKFDEYITAVKGFLQAHAR